VSSFSEDLLALQMDDPVIGSTVRRTNAKALNLGKEPPIKLDGC
jgi:hypothetical protein